MASPGSVLILDENLPVPFDRRVWNESLALRDAGYEVVVICPQNAQHAAAVEVIDDIRILRHPMPREARRAREYLLEYGEALWHETRLSHVVRSWRAPDVVHLCNPPDLLFLPALVTRARCGSAIVFDHHDLCPELYEAKYGRRDGFYWAQRVAERLTYAAADVVIATNESYRETALVRGGKRPEEVIVVRNGPDTTWFSPVAPTERFREGRTHVVGYVGTMAEQEGIDVLVRVAGRVADALGRTTVRFVLVGGGPGLEALRRYVADQGAADVVHFTGRISDADMLECLSGCDVCVNPDPKTPFNDKSTMIKIMEYMALGKPIVQFDVLEGRRSAGDASLYAHGGDEAEFADLVVSLLGDPDRRAYMGGVGRERVEREMSWQCQVPHLLAAYDVAMKARERRTSRRARPLRRV
jgi:glycosyltransferase involved in cell wall biosynthesis